MRNARSQEEKKGRNENTSNWPSFHYIVRWNGVYGQVSRGLPGGYTKKSDGGELIDRDGVLSAGFARHLAHRQRLYSNSSIRRSPLLSIVFSSFPFLVPWLCDRVANSIPGQKTRGKDKSQSHRIPRQLSTLPHQHVGNIQLALRVLNGVVHLVKIAWLLLFIQ